MLGVMLKLLKILVSLIDLRILVTHRAVYTSLNIRK